MTGESLPASKEKDDIIYSGAIVRQGEMVVLVIATGARTYFGQTARLVAGAGEASHFQKAVIKIGNTLIYLSLALVVVLALVQLFRGSALTQLLQFALVLTVASIPVAMPAVLSVTMAVGAMALSKRKTIVSRLESIEEMAGMDILCSDKTGTLTQNKLTLGTPRPFSDLDPQELILMAALASKAENDDSIDSAVFDSLENPRILVGKNIRLVDKLLEKEESDPSRFAGLGKQTEEADGFAQVFPKHKYDIVKALQARGHMVGMTGDGVNDAPALKQADMGIAVSGATDAARAAADLILTAPGLSVMIRAVEEARRILERMSSYAVYRITETIRIMIFVVLAMIVFNFYPITAITIILLAFLNDVPIMTIACGGSLRFGKHCIIYVTIIHSFLHNFIESTVGFRSYSSWHIE